MKNGQLLGLDIGTTGVKGIVINEQGETVAAATAGYSLATPRPNWAEQDPHQWWNATVDAVRQLTANPSVRPESIRGVGLSGQMHSLVLLDADHAILRPAILWCDTRTDRECRWINETVGRKNLAALVSNPALEGFTLPKIVWVRDNEPAVYERIAHILLPKDYVRFRLTGEIATEVSDAAGTLMFDVRNRIWSHKLLEKVGVPRSWLPPVRESVALCGTITPRVAEQIGLAAGTPVVGGGADNTCGAVGTGVVVEGRVLASIGTSGVVFAHSDSVKVEPEMRLHTFCHSVPHRWYLMGVMLMAGGALRWYRDTFAPALVERARAEGIDAYDLITQEAERVPAGSEGLFFQPYLAGERTPHQSAAARGGFVGATIRHTKEHFSRAVLEGITFGMRDSLEIIRGLGINVRQIRLTGGGAKSKFWRHLQADIYGSEVAVVNSTEGPAFGAAVLAAVGTGIFGDLVQATEEIVKVVETIEPDPKAAELYTEYFGIYAQLYPALEVPYSVIHEEFHSR